MPRINVKANVVAPEEITINLVREDLHATSNIFRIAFEIFLALFGGLLGHDLSITNPTPLHYISLLVCAVAAVSFLVCSLKFGKKSKDV